MRSRPHMLAMLGAAAALAAATPVEPQKPKQRAKWCGQRKVGRNEPCPCDSGKKFKKCCGSPLNGAGNP